MMALPIGQSLPQMQTQWKQQLDPVLANLLLDGLTLNNIVLTANTPATYNHSLGRQQRGYIITYQNANAAVWVTQAFNSKTITLESSANVTLNLWNF
jgi:hypothetical protein